MSSASPLPSPSIPKLCTAGLTVRYDGKLAVRDIDLEIPARTVLALIGPSGCGKSSFLRSLNRMLDGVEGAEVSGQVFLDGEDIYRPEVDIVGVRQRVGMVFQRSHPFAKSIFENVAFGLRVAGVRDRRVLETRVERALRQAALWDEVKDRLKASGLDLSGGQQQRLCIARALAVSPEVLLMDEPASALDPIATEKIEELVRDLRDSLTVVIVTHNLQQAVRVSQKTAFFHMGRLVEVGETGALFSSPREKETADYVAGRFG